MEDRREHEMKCRITFAVEPDTTYVYNVTDLEEARREAFELALRLNRSEWTVECDGVKLWCYDRK